MHSKGKGIIKNVFIALGIYSLDKFQVPKRMSKNKTQEFGYASKSIGQA